jgi:hypothetical protein
MVFNALTGKGIDVHSMGTVEVVSLMSDLLVTSIVLFLVRERVMMTARDTVNTMNHVQQLNEGKINLTFLRLWLDNHIPAH